MGTPLPEDIPTECRKAAKVIEKFIKPSSTTGPDQLIPPDIIANAKGIAILTVIKAGFLFSGTCRSIHSLNHCRLHYYYNDHLDPFSRPSWLWHCRCSRWDHVKVVVSSQVSSTRAIL